MDNVEVDIGIIGGGVIGLGLAKAFGRRGHEAVIFEAEPFIGSQTSSRNSGVLHAGLNDVPGGIMALYAVAGRQLLYRYAEEHHISCNNCGKLVVATSEDEIKSLSDLKRNAEKNGVTRTQLLTPAQAAEIEPEVFCHHALYVPESGIIDTSHLLETLGEEVKANGTTIMLGTKVIGGNATEKRLVVITEGHESYSVSYNMLFNAGGLGAQSVARNLVGLDTRHIPAQKLGKGNYFSIGKKIRPFHTMIYPVPTPTSKGIHSRLDFDGQTIFGPDHEVVEHVDYNPNVDRLIFFRETIGRYWRDMPDVVLGPAYAGVRPKLDILPTEPYFEQYAAHGCVIQGPAQHNIPGLYNLFGVASPGLTASLALTEALAEASAPARGGRPYDAPAFPYRLH